MPGVRSGALRGDAVLRKLREFGHGVAGASAGGRRFPAVRHVDRPAAREARRGRPVPRRRRRRGRPPADRGHRRRRDRERPACRLRAGVPPELLDGRVGGGARQRPGRPAPDHASTSWSRSRTRRAASPRRTSSSGWRATTSGSATVTRATARSRARSAAWHGSARRAGGIESAGGPGSTSATSGSTSADGTRLGGGLKRGNPSADRVNGRQRSSSACGQTSASATAASTIPCASATPGLVTWPACTLRPSASDASARSAACQPLLAIARA